MIPGPANFGREGKPSMNRFRAWALVLAGLTLAACNEEGMKYYSGPEDPALNVTSDDLEEVHQLIQEQKQKDIARGIREPAPVQSADAGELPPGHPPMTSGASLASIGSASADGLTNLQVLEGRLPEGWTAGPPSSQMRLAEISIPPAEGDPEGGTIAVFPEIGGGVEANIERWYKQFMQPDGRSTKEAAKVEFLTAESGLDIILVDVSGTFDGSTMMSAMEPQENWRLLGAIVKAPTGLVFLKGTGPEATMAAAREPMVAFLRTLQLPGSGGPQTAAAPTPAPISGGPQPPQPAASGEEPKRVETHGGVDPSGGNVPVSAGGGAVDLGVATGTLPDGWLEGTPSSSMRVAEIQLPGAGGNGELVAFYFGPNQGGSVDDNITRWVGQMQGAEEPQRETFYAGGMQVTMVDVTGTFTATSMRPNAPPAEAMPNTRLLGAIVESPRGSLFLKATGPEDTMASHRERFIAFLKSLEPKL